MADGGDVVVAALADASQGAASLTIEVAFSPRAAVVDRVLLRLPVGSSVADALRHSGLEDRHPALRDAAVSGLGLGIWGRRCSPQQGLREGDRVEVYRPLQVDPMQARRDRQRRQSAALRGAAAACSKDVGPAGVAGAVHAADAFDAAGVARPAATGSRRR